MKDCIFDFIVITAPSEAICSTYEVQIRHLQKSSKLIRNVVISCVADPSGKRIGSGGGTLHALHMVAQINGMEKLVSSRILIIHSGGDARRSPMYSVCGKAWMILNDMVDDHVVNPLILLIDELNAFFEGRIPDSCLVVACSDVLLDFQTEKLSTTDGERLPLDGEGVYVVAVPAISTVAKNHGVLSNKSLLQKLRSNFDSTDTCFCSADLYFQKPSITMMEKHGALFGFNTFNHALIDTGVVVFTQKPLTHLYTLLHCSSIFRQSSAGCDIMRFELYNELLCSCITSSTINETFLEYVERVGMSNDGLDLSNVENHALYPLWKLFHDTVLKIIFIRGGSFKHVGTSREVLDLLSSNAAHCSAKRFVQSLCPSNHTHGQSLPILVNSILLTSQHDHQPNENSLFCENCILKARSIDSDRASCLLPSVGFLSNLYSSFSQELSNIPERMIVQQAFLNNKCVVAQGIPQSNVWSLLMCLGIDDDVKADYTAGHATIYGLPWSRFFELTNTSRQHIWDEDELDNSIWTAKLFPVLAMDGDRTKLSVVVNEQLQSTPWKQIDMMSLCCNQDTIDINLWKQCKRLSLKELISVADTDSFFSWRLLLTTAIRYVQGGESSGKEYLCYSNLDSIHICWRQWKSMLTRRDSTVSDSDAADRLLAILLASRFVEWTSLSSEKQLHLCQLLNLNDMSTDAIQHHLQNITNACGAFEDESVASENFQSFSCIFLSFLRSMSQNLNFICEFVLQTIPSISFNKGKVFPRILLAFNWLYDGHKLFVKSDVIQATLSAIDWTPNMLSLTDESQLYDQLCHTVRSIVTSATSMTEPFMDTEQTVCEVMASLAQQLVCHHIQSSLKFHQQTNELGITALSMSPSHRNIVCVARCPVRIDLAGGWSDTPPICYDQSGSVLNVAIRVDGQCPIKCASTFNKSFNCHLQCWKRMNEDTAAIEDDIELLGEEVVESMSALLNLSLNSPCALIKACLIVLIFQNSLMEQNLSLDAFLNKAIGSGISVATFSNLPAGSGMGGSSILAATILKSIGALIKLDLSNEQLIYLVSEVEQLLTTGGGWQDQIGGSFGGFKVSRSLSRLPLEVQVEPVQISTEFLKLFSARTFLVFTGQQRLAKNTLINALRKYSVTCFPDDSLFHCWQTVGKLVVNSENGADLLRGTGDDEVKLAGLGKVLSRYWSLKMEMAPGSEPPHIKKIMDSIRPLCYGLSLCGAGAGGFAALIVEQGVDFNSIQAVINKLNEELEDKLSLHQVAVDEVGLAVEEFLVSKDGELKHYLV